MKAKKNSKQLDLIIDAARSLGWNIAFPVSEDMSMDVPGFIVGDPDYIKELTDSLPERFIIFEPETLH